MTCASGENEFHESLGTDEMFFTVTRTMDDCLGLTVYSQSVPQTKEKAEGLIARYQTECYTSDLILEREPITNNTTRYLEAKMDFYPQEVRTRHFCKNYESLVTTGRQKYHNMQAYDSFSSIRSKKGVLVCRFISISQTCQRRSDLIFSMKRFFFQMKKLGYSNKILKKSCWRMFQRTNNRVWIKLQRCETLRGK